MIVLPSLFKIVVLQCWISNDCFTVLPFRNFTLLYFRARCQVIYDVVRCQHWKPSDCFAFVIKHCCIAVLEAKWLFCLCNITLLYCSSGSQVIVLPSYRDVHHDYVYPQPPFFHQSQNAQSKAKSDYPVIYDFRNCILNVQFLSLCTGSQCRWRICWRTNLLVMVVLNFRCIEHFILVLCWMIHLEKTV